LGDQIEKNEMGEPCSTYGGKESFIQGFGGEKKGEALGVDGMIILKLIFK
jgi:hypothetical protein